MSAVALANLLPRMPAVLIRIGVPACLVPWASISSNDPRLKQLQEAIENGEEPFFFDNGAILRAAPKKKMSYRRHRTKLYAPGVKQIKPLNNIVRCPACGLVKRSHFMCMHCFAEIKTFLKEKKKALVDFIEPPQTNLDPIDKAILYPGKKLSAHEVKLKEGKWIPRREEPLEYHPDQVRKCK